MWPVRKITNQSAKTERIASSSSRNGTADPAIVSLSNCLHYNDIRGERWAGVPEPSTPAPTHRALRCRSAPPSPGTHAGPGHSVLAVFRRVRIVPVAVPVTNGAVTAMDDHVTIAEQYERAQNHVSAAEAWTITASVALHVAERDGLSPTVYGPVLSLLGVAVDRNLDALVQEVLAREHLREHLMEGAVGIADPFVYSAGKPYVWLACRHRASARAVRHASARPGRDE